MTSSPELIEFRVSAPGKVILHGEHSVVFGHLAIAASLNLRSSLEFKEYYATSLEEKTAIFKMPDIDLEVTVPTSVLMEHVLSLTNGESWDFDHPDDVNFDKMKQKIETFIDTQLNDLPHSKRLAMTSCLFLMATILHQPNQVQPRNLTPFVMHISSELPVGAGAGSSASFCVCLAASFLHLAFKRSNPKGHFQLDDKTKGLVSHWAFLGERILHGRPSGLDNSICTFGSVIAFRKPNTIQKIPFDGSLQVLLVDTRVSRNTQFLIEKVASLKLHHKTTVNKILEAMNSVSEEAIKLLHQWTQVNRSKEFQTFARMEELWSINHSLLTALGVSHPTLEQIVKLAKDHELSCKLTGAGGGGFALVLVPPGKFSSKGDAASIESTVATLKSKLSREGYDIKEVELGGSGVELH